MIFMTGPPLAAWNKEIMQDTYKAAITELREKVEKFAQQWPMPGLVDL